MSEPKPTEVESVDLDLWPSHLIFDLDLLSGFLKNETWLPHIKKEARMACSSHLAISTSTNHSRVGWPWALTLTFFHSRFPKEWDVRSSHKIRSSDDMQFAFSYFYFMMPEPKPTTVESVNLDLWPSHLIFHLDLIFAGFLRSGMWPHHIRSGVPMTCSLHLVSVENSWNFGRSPTGDLPWKSGSPDQKQVALIDK